MARCRQSSLGALLHVLLLFFTQLLAWLTIWMPHLVVWFLQHCPWQKVDPRCVHLLSSTARTGRNLCQIRSRWSWIAQLQLTKTLPCFYSTKKKLLTIPGMESCVSCEVARMRRTMCMTPMVTYRSFKFHWKWLDFCRYGWYGHGFMA